MYSGSPISYSFAEAGHQKQVLIVDLEPGKDAFIRAIELKSGRKLERKRFLNQDEAETWLKNNPTSLVELTLVSDTFLSGADRRRLMDIHDGIVVIIPEISGLMEQDIGEIKSSTQQKGMQELFVEFFRNRKGQEPGPSLMKLFLEVNAEEDER
jgi:exonuclease SbcD